MKDIITVIIITFLFLWLGIAHATEVKVLVDDAVVYQFNCETPPPPSCGDGICNVDETCVICPQDCGVCPPVLTGKDIGADFYTVYPNVRTDSIPANGVIYYYFKLSKTVSNLGIVIVSLDWVTDQDLIVSKKQQPTIDIYNQVRNSGTNSRAPSATYWYNFNKGTLEQLELSNVGGNAGDVFYVTVFNVSDRRGSYQIYWYPY